MQHGERINKRLIESLEKLELVVNELVATEVMYV